MSVWDELAAERARAHAKHGEKSLEASDWTAERRLRVLTEELGEVAREFNDAELEDRPIDPDRLRAELIQLGAMAAAWADVVPAGAAVDDMAARLARKLGDPRRPKHIDDIAHDKLEGSEDS